jgi:hypothetical protein
MPGNATDCIACGIDCSKPPRAKDAGGRYMCVPCFEKQRAKGAARGPTAPVTPIPATAPVGVALALATPGDDGLNPIPFADEEPPLGLLNDAVAAAAKDAAPRACPHCAVIMARDGIICTQCGFNTQTGRNVGTGNLAGTGKKCSNCGYDLAGLKNSRCPECGTLNKPKKLKDFDRETARDVTRREYIKPLVMLVAGLLLGGAFLADKSDPLNAIVGYGIVLGLQTVLGFVVYFVCILFGFDANSPFGLAAFRLLGVYALFNALVLFVAMVPFAYVPMVLQLLILGGLLTWAFDLDIQDGVILALVNMGAWIALRVALAFMAM